MHLGDHDVTLLSKKFMLFSGDGISYISFIYFHVMSTFTLKCQHKNKMFQNIILCYSQNLSPIYQLV